MADDKPQPESIQLLRRLVSYEMTQIEQQRETNRHLRWFRLVVLLTWVFPICLWIVTVIAITASEPLRRAIARLFGVVE